MNRTRVLVVDDEPAIREALVDLLSTVHGLEIVGLAANADEAVNVAAREAPDIALIDVRMPGGGGPEAARRVMRVSPGTQIIALSAYDDEGSVEEMLRAGARSYLVKGCTADELFETMRTVARGEAVLTGGVGNRAMEAFVTRLAQHEQSIESGHSDRERLKTAIDTELTMTLQPVVDGSTRRPVGVEAFASLRSDGRLQSTSLALDAARLGLSVTLERRLLELVAEAAHEVHPDLWISANVSVDTLRSPALVEVLQGVHLSRLVLEISEQGLTADLDATVEALADLRASGVLVALDATGGPAASVYDICQLAPDVLKLDPGLLDMGARCRSALVGAWVVLAGQLGARVVAQGVDRLEDLSLYTSLGVQLTQGRVWADQDTARRAVS